jgi:hypothetical protein
VPAAAARSLALLQYGAEPQVRRAGGRRPLLGLGLRLGLGLGLGLPGRPQPGHNLATAWPLHVLPAGALLLLLASRGGASPCTRPPPTRPQAPDAARAYLISSAAAKLAPASNVQLQVVDDDGPVGASSSRALAAIHYGLAHVGARAATARAAACPCTPPPAPARPSLRPVRSPPPPGISLPRAAAPS